MAYEGSVELISGIKQANNGTFPLVDASAVRVTDETRLDTELENLKTATAGKYVKPGTGIPATDLTSAVQTSLGKADTAYQKPSGGIPASDIASGVIPEIPAVATTSETQAIITEYGVTV